MHTHTQAQANTHAHTHTDKLKPIHTHIHTSSSQYTRIHTQTSLSQYTHTSRSRSHLEGGPAVLLLQEGYQQRDAILLADHALGHLSTGVPTGDVPEGAQGGVNDLLTPSGILDGLEQSLRGREGRGGEGKD